MKFHRLLPVLALVACQTTSAPPDRVGQDIVTALEEGRPGAAARLFERVRDDPDYNERIYPMLYEAAQRHYTAGELDEAITLLQFVTPRYPEGSSARLALAYGLFRSYAQSPDDDLRHELDAVIGELRSQDAALPAWIDLFEVQLAIDEGDMDLAEESFDRFLSTWDGRPAEMMAYVEDVGRYIASH